MKRILIFIGLTTFLSGCATPQQQQKMSQDAQAVFRARCMKVLEEAAFGDEPADRMQALEAFKEVARAKAWPCKPFPQHRK
ncbi:MAG: lipoprotein [Planctomycetes bacterium]|nr:lipoprotein [Planctomycetota bacterium]